VQMRGQPSLLPECAEAFAREASTVWNRYPARNAAENASGSGTAVRSWTIPLQYDWCLLIAAN
jgi:hypothetical protein